MMKSVGFASPSLLTLSSFKDPPSTFPVPFMTSLMSLSQKLWMEGSEVTYPGLSIQGQYLICPSGNLGNPETQEGDYKSLNGVPRKWQVAGELALV